MITVHAISDLHGYLPRIPPGDVLLIAGDVTPLSMHEPMLARGWFHESLRPWLDAAPVRYIVATWGNHDFIGRETFLLDEFPPLRWRVLVDQEVTLDFPETGESVRVYGSPWTLQVPRQWPWMTDERGLGRKWRNIPRGLDVLMTHGPPHGILDRARDGERCGSRSLAMKIREVKPLYTIFGHIHESHGCLVDEGLLYFNVSHVNHRYMPVNGVTTFYVGDPATGPPATSGAR